MAKSNANDGPQTADSATKMGQFVVEELVLDQLHEDPANVRRHGLRNVEAIKASLARFGQQKPIVINQQNVVVAGNGTLAAARELGWATIKVVRTSLLGAEAVAFAIADNRTAELAQWDEPALAAMLESLQNETDLDALVTGFSLDEIAQLIKGKVAPEAEPPEEFREYDETIETQHVCPKCGYRWSGNAGGEGDDNDNDE
jgi:ParB-like chromosome segregation protein Spo0J